MRRRGYFFTCWSVDKLLEDWSNSPNQNSYPEVLLWCKWQIEACPDTGKLHAQGACWFKDAKEPQNVRKFFNESPETMYYCEPIMSIEGAQKYVAKEASRVWGPWEYGELPEILGRGHRSDLDRDFALASAGQILECSASTLMRYTKGVEFAYKLGNEVRWQNQLREVEVHVLWGKPGVGKSKFVWDKYPATDTYRGATVKSDGTMWFNGYREQRILVLDDFPPTKSEIDYTWFLKVLDVYPIQIETKGSYLWAAWDKVVITSMKKPEKWFPKEKNEALLRRIKTCTEVVGNIGSTTGPTTEPESVLDILEEM